MSVVERPGLILASETDHKFSRAYTKRFPPLTVLVRCTQVIWVAAAMGLLRVIIGGDKRCTVRRNSQCNG